MNILFITKEHYNSQRPTLVEFFPKHISKYAEITYIQPIHYSEFKRTSCKEIDANRYVIEHYSGSNFFLKFFNTI